MRKNPDAEGSRRGNRKAFPYCYFSMKEKYF